VEFRRPCANLVAIKSNRGQAFAPYPTAIAKDGLAAFARIAVQKAVLALPPNFRWLILSFHKSFKIADP
jgi:hypothetical protein